MNGVNNQFQQPQIISPNDGVASQKPETTTGTENQRKIEMEKPASYGGDQKTLAILEKLSVKPETNDTYANLTAETTFKEDAMTYLSNSKGGDGLYIVKGPAGNDFAFQKTGNIALCIKYENQNLDDLNIQFSEIRKNLPTDMPPRTMTESIKNRINAAIEKGDPTGRDTIPGGSQTQDVNRAANGFKQRARAFFSSMFGSMRTGFNSFTERATNLSLTRNLREAFRGSVDKSVLRTDIDSLGSKVEEFKQQFIGNCVANKNLKADDPRHQEFLDTHVKGAIKETENLLAQIKSLKGQVETKQLEKMEKDAKQMLAVLKSISGEPRLPDPELTPKQEWAMELLQIRGENRTDKESKELYLLLNSFTKEDLLVLIEEQSLRVLESQNTDTKAIPLPFDFFSRMRGAAPDANVFKDFKPTQSSIQEFGLARLCYEERSQYSNTFRALSEEVEAARNGYLEAKEKIINIYTVLSETLGLDTATTFNELSNIMDNTNLDRIAKELINIRFDDIEIASKTNEAIKPVFTDITNANSKFIEIRDKVNKEDIQTQKEIKDKWATKIKDKFPEYKKESYNREFITKEGKLNHPFDMIFSVMSSPSMAGAVVDNYKTLLKSEEKLRQKTPDDIGIKMESPKHDI